VKTQRRKTPIDARRAEAQEVIDILNRWDARMNGHQTQKRNHERKPFASRICIYHAERHGAFEKEQEGIVVWARNVSAKGIAFIYKGRIEWKRILVCLDPDSGEATWMHAEIVRCRNVHNDFWDYGARFLRRATSDDALPAVANTVG
jgi:hypothetical protein